MGLPAPLGGPSLAPHSVAPEGGQGPPRSGEAEGSPGQRSPALPAAGHAAGARARRVRRVRSAPPRARPARRRHRRRRRGSGRLTWPLIPPAAPRAAARRQPPGIGLWVGASQMKPPRSPPRPRAQDRPPHRWTDRRTDRRPSRAGRRRGLPAWNQSDQPARPPPPAGATAPGCSPGSGPLSARKLAWPREARARSGRGGGSLAQGGTDPGPQPQVRGESRARFLCAARKTAGTPRAKPAPPQRELRLGPANTGVPAAL